MTLRRYGLFIGAMVSLAEVIENPMIRKHVPTLAESAQRVASPQVRNQGTVGGNLLQERRCLYFNQSESWRAQIPACYALGGNVCHQIPSSKVCRALYYSDLAPVLLAFDSGAEIMDGQGPKTLSLQELIHRHATGVNGKFILKGLSIPHFSAGTRGKFLKAGVRSAIDFALVNVAVRYSPAGSHDENPQIRIVVGAMSPEPFYLEETARELAKSGKGLSCEAIAESVLKEGESRVSRIRETAVSDKTKKQSLAMVEHLRRLGIRVLRNERVEIGDRGASIDLAGIDDWRSAGMAPGHGPDLAAALSGREPDRSLVLLAHQPRGVEEGARAGVELQVSGHTHGGQIFPFTLATALVYPYLHGLYGVKDGAGSQIFVSRGTGYWGPPMRLGSPPEIAHVVLT